LAHQTGKFVNGFEDVPLNMFEVGNPMSEAIRQSFVMNQEIVKRNVAQNPVVKAAMTSAAGGGGPFTASVTLERTGQTGGIQAGFMSGDFGHGGSQKSVDLHYGIGGFLVLRLALTIEGHAGPIPGTVVVTGVSYDAKLSDLYDWDWEINPFGVILQAGFQSYGQHFGQPFVNQWHVKGSLNETFEVDLSQQ
jgi:hypothetical protein